MPDGEGESFPDWKEQFELVAEACCWTDQSKLVNLITRLRGQAYSYYRSCTPEQRSSYPLLVKALEERFTPVRIQAVQSSRFHERKQSSTENVDNYAQDLRKLYQKAYPSARQGSKECEAMGRSVLAYQFTAGLLPHLKAKIAGQEGTFEELLTKARFEEAKYRDIVETEGVRSKPPSAGHAVATGRNPFMYRRSNPAPPRSGTGKQPESPRCYHCGATNHLRRDCPLRGRSAPPEAVGNKAVNNAVLNKGGTIGTTSTTGKKIAMLTADKESEPSVDAIPGNSGIEDAIEQASATLHGIKPESIDSEFQLGPTPTSEVSLEGSPTKALLDSGSPVSIVSLDFFIKACIQNRKAEQSPAEWGEEVKRRCRRSTVSLRSYGGGELNIVSEVECCLTRGNYTVKAILQVQKGAPVDLLLGTDTLSKLGFSFQQIESDGHSVELLSKSDDIGKPSDQVLADNSSDLGESGHTVLPTPEKVAIVKLLQTARLPAHHSKLVRVAVDHEADLGSTLLFEPNLPQLHNKGVTMSDALIDNDKVATMIIQNRGVEPVILDQGCVMGYAHSTSMMKLPKDEDCHLESSVKTIQGSVRMEQLCESLNIKGVELHQGEQSKLMELVEKYSELFALSSTELGCTSLIEHSINTGDHLPIKQLPRRVPHFLKTKVSQHVQEMLKQGVVTPSHSPWASPVVLVAKKDGTTRFCVDYRKLNAVTKMDVHPLPRIDDSLDQLAGSCYFSTLDLASGYWQVGMHEESQEKTAFATWNGLYEFKVMPFGLCNAPTTFQRLMEKVLSGAVREKCLIYLDDILVMGQTFEEHINNLRMVFDCLLKAGLRLKPGKCKLVRKQVEYLGYVVSSTGISADREKVLAVQGFPRPTELRALRAFLGLTSYYRRFIPCYSSIAQPLYNLTRKDAPYQWTEACENAFVRLKDCLTQAPVLAYPQFDVDFFLETDASGTGLGAVLSQRQSDNTVRPIAFASRTLQPHERNYGISELEGLGVVWAVKHFRCYLYGHHCTVLTDHEALKSLLRTPHPSGKLARWGMALQELDLTIEYRPGSRNQKADALSRYPVSLLKSESPEELTPAVVAAVDTYWRGQSNRNMADTLSERQRADPALSYIIRYLEDAVLPDDDKKARELVLGRSQYTILESVLYKVENDSSLRILVPQRDREELFKEAHEGVFGSHLREAKIYSQLSKHYWWPGMRSDVSYCCRACLVCATRNVGQAIKPLLTPIPVGGPFDRVGVDILQLPKSSRGNRYAVVFMDYLTKWPEVFPAADQSAPTIAKLLVERIISRHGVPKELLSDRGASFLSKLIAEICKVMGIKKVNTTAYHPQSDGLVERFNRTLLDMLSKTVKAGGKDWDVRLPYLLFAYRSTVQPSTGESPFFLLYGRDPQLPTDIALSPPAVRHTMDLDDYKSTMLMAMSSAWKLAQENLQKAQKKQKCQHDKRARNTEFTVGDRVFVYMPAIRSGPAYKLTRPYKGPYQVVSTHSNGVELQSVQQPKTKPIRVALNRVRRCPVPLADGEEVTVEQVNVQGDGQGDSQDDGQSGVAPDEEVEEELEEATCHSDEVQKEATHGTWRSRLRPRKSQGRL